MRLYELQNKAIDDPNFKRWFGNSKVVDYSGSPLPVYHGSKTDFDSFSIEGQGKTYGTGAYFTDNPKVAATYTTNGPIYPVYLSIKNPLIVDVAGANWDSIDRNAVIELPDGTQDSLHDYMGVYQEDDIATDDIARYAKTEGYDGAIIYGVRDRGYNSEPSMRTESTIYVIFNSNQAKSVFNKGTYSQDTNNISEAPIADFAIDNDFEQNQKIMKQKEPDNFHHWHTSDTAALKSDNVWKVHKKTFAATKYPFNIYVFQDTNPNYDRWMGKTGMTIDDPKFTPKMREWFEKHDYQNRVNIILANNLSDEAKISIRSSWILAHRIAHAIVLPLKEDELSAQVMHTVNNTILKLATLGYGVQWNDYDYDMNQFYFEAYGKLFGHILGTMKSARSKNLVSHYEWILEMFVQWLLKGKITLNALPEQIHPEEKPLTNDPEKRKAVQKLWAQLPQRLDALFDKQLQQAVGVFSST